VRLGLGIANAEADDAPRGNPNDPGVDLVVVGLRAPLAGLGQFGGPLISRHRTRQGSRDTMSSITSATVLLDATLRNLRLFDIR
jgi:hypothetical protein